MGTRPRRREFTAVVAALVALAAVVLGGAGPASGAPGAADGHIVDLTTSTPGKLVYGTDTAVDASGNVYFVGNGGGSVTLSGGTTLDLGISSGFVVKYNASGAIVWTRSMTSGSFQGVAVDRQGNPTVVGSSVAGATLSTPTGHVVFDSVGGVVIAMDPAGGVRWSAANIGASAFARDVATGGGRVFVSGPFGPAVFGPQGTQTVQFGSEPGAPVLSTDRPSRWLAAYDGDGSVVWAQLDGDGGPAGAAASVAVDGLGTVYSTLGGVTARDRDGNVLWTSPFDAEATSLAGAAQGGVYVGGVLCDGGGGVFHLYKRPCPATFGAGDDLIQVGTTGWADAFALALDADGNRVWLRHGGSPENDGTTVAADCDGNVALVGTATAQIWIGSNVFSPGGGTATVPSGPDAIPIASAGKGDGFVTVLDPNGSVRFSYRLGGFDGDDAGGASIGADGSLYLIGSLASATGTFSSAAGDESFDRTGSGTTDAYLAVYGMGIAAGSCPPPDPAMPVAAAPASVSPRFTG